MVVEDRQKIDQNMEDRANQLRQLVLQLTAGVEITETDAELIEIQELLRKKLLEDIGVLLVVAAPNQTRESLWDLFEPHLPAGQLSDQELSLCREQLSKPLAGQPSEVSKMTGFGQQGHPFNETIDNLRSAMTPEQHMLLPKVTGRVV